MVLACYTLSYHDNHLCQIIFESHHAIQTDFTEAYAQSQVRTVAFTFDIAAWDTPSCHADLLCHINLKSHHAIQSYWSDTYRFQQRL